MEASERLQKLLAGAGHGSRRTIEEWIREGRVTVNGRVAELGLRATPGDDIRLDGKRLELGGAAPAGVSTVLLYNKPLGEVTTRSDPQGRPTVFDHLPPPPHGRWIVVGRLDVNTSGLLLFTTDGELAHKLMHPSAEVEREYLVRSRSALSETQLRALLTGVQLEDGPGRFDQVIPSRTEGTHAWYRVILREGRNREVRRLWQAVDSEVSRLLRIRYGPVQLPKEMTAGAWQLLAPEQVAGLAAAAAKAKPRAAVPVAAAVEAPAAPGSPGNAGEGAQPAGTNPWYRGRQPRPARNLKKHPG